MLNPSTNMTDYLFAVDVRILVVLLNFKFKFSDSDNVIISA